MSDRTMTDSAAAGSPTDAIVVECDLEQPPAVVWKALTVPELLAAWMMPNDIDPEPGRRFSFVGDGDTGGPVACEVLAAEPHRLLRYSWRVGTPESAGRALDTTVTFVLNATPAGGTHLRIVHDGFDAASSTQAPIMLAGAGRAQAALIGERYGNVVPLRPARRCRLPVAGLLRRAA